VGGEAEFDPAADDARAWLEGLVGRANTGDPEAVAGLRAFLDANPELWRRIGDLGGHAEAAWAGLVARGDRLIAESVRREADRLRAELLGERPGPVERLLADQVVVTHLELHYHQLRAADAPGVTRGQRSAADGRLAGAQRRHLAAVRMLAAVRKLTGRAGAGSTLRVFPAGEGDEPGRRGGAGGGPAA
jgi:hypothetical protein